MKTARERILEFQLHFGRKLSLSEYRVMKLFIEYTSQQQELPIEEEIKSILYKEFLKAVPSGTGFEVIHAEEHADNVLEAITNLLKGE